MRQRLLPCGRVIYYEETTPKDIGSQLGLSRKLLANRKRLDKLWPYYNSGRRNNRWVADVYNKFTTLLTERLVSHLLQGDRIETLDGHRWMIARGKDHPKHVNWHSDGKTFHVTIRGVDGNYGIRLSKRKRRELADKIKGGQMYHE